MQKILNITELSKYIQIPKRTLYRMVRDGRFPVEPIKGLHPSRWSVETIDEWLCGKK